MQSRVRNWSDFALQEYRVTGSWRDDYDGLLPWPTGTQLRQLTDWTSKRSVRGRLPSSPCYDIRAVFRPEQMGPWFSYWTGSRRAEHSNGLFQWDPEYFKTDLVNRSTGEASLAQRAFDAFADQVPEDVSLGNFALEWREAVELIPNLVEHFVRAKPYLKNGMVRKGGSSVTDGASDAFLQWNFAVAPLIGDLQALAGLVQSTLARLQWIRDHNGKTTPMGYTSHAVNPGVPAVPPQVVLQIPGVDTANPVATLVETEGVFRAKCLLSIKIPEEELDGMIGFCRAFVGKTGLNNPLGVIWNAIPFSFVLDWFFRFSDMLARRKVRPFTGEWAVKDFTWSIKTSTAWVVEQPFKSAPFTWSPIPLRRGTINVTRYERGLGLPGSELSTLLKGGLTPKQAALLLALSR